MKKRLLSAFLAVMMVLTMAPMAFAAEGNGTAENALPSTIEQDTTLNDNYTADITVPAGKTVTLDLDGHTLTNTGRGKATLSVAGNATVKNGTIIGGISYYNIEVTKGGSLTLENVTATAGNTRSSMIDNWGTLTIEGGDYRGGLDVVKSEPGATLLITDGTFALNHAVAWSFTGVVLSYGDLTITGGTFNQNAKDPAKAYPTVVVTAKDKVDAPTPHTKITGGVFNNAHSSSNAKIFHPMLKATSDNFEVSGGSFNKSVPSGYLKDGLVCKKNTTTGMYELTTGATGVTLSESEKTIKVGESFKLEATLTPEDAELKRVEWKESSKGKIATVNKNNGTVKGIAIGDVTITATPNAAGATPATCKVHVYDEAAQIGETIYPTLEQAIAAVQTGETIKLLKNIQVSKTIEVNKDCSIDLNGFTLTGKRSTSSGCRVFTVANSGKLMLTGTGVVTMGASIENGSSSSVIDVAEGGALAIGEKVTITTGHCNGISVAGTAEMNGTVEVTKSGFHAVTSTGTATIKEGYYNGSFDGTNGTITISGGYFTVDPTKYLATSAVKNKKYIAKAVTGDYKFHVELTDENDLQVVSVAGATAAPSKEELENNKDIPSAKVDNIVTAAKAVSAPEISKAAQEVAANISDNSNTLDKQYQNAAKNEVPNQEKIEVRTYLDVEPKAYNEKSAYTLDITPKYDVVVVGTNTENEKVEKKVVEGQKLLVKNGDKVQVSIQLPTGFVQDKNTKLYVQHKGHEYDPKVNKSGDVYTATFTNPNGFSEFTISKTSQSVAKVGNNKYTTFQDAVNAVANGGTIEIVGGNKDYTATISGDSKTFTVKNTLDSDITVKVNNDSKTVGKNNGTQSFTYTKPSSGGSSSGKTTYKVTTSAVNNGGVNASPSNVEKGATITITLSPDKGYKLDKLTVTDGSGKTVSTVKKSDTVYTFTMPASAVKVGVSYVKATETPSKTKFNDVSANDWFASAVDYVTGKGMMNGTADNTFPPKANTTRGMVVTVLYRLENQPSTSAASFTDVASGAYYANAVAWANANGIVSGYGSGKFGPNDKVTREQLAAILYRYAQYKKYDVSVGEDTNILSYDDAQSISTYAIPAIQWACGAGVVTGKSGSKLDPKGNATRAEVAAMLMRFCENVK